MPEDNELIDVFMPFVKAWRRLMYMVGRKDSWCPHEILELMKECLTLEAEK